MTVTVTLPDGKAARPATTAPQAPTPRPRSGRALRARRWRSRSAIPRPGKARELRDLSRPLPDGAHVAIITAKSGEQALELIRHDAAHVLAAAVMELYEGVKISIGPPIADGFYYDFEFPDGTTISEADFPKIEERMRAHVKAAEVFEREDVPVAQRA